MIIGENLKPIIKFNNGNPVALCNRCRVMMCYVTNNENDGKREKWVVRKPLVVKEADATTKPVGEEVPTHCDECIKLLNLRLNE